jgi:ACS family tartrate transporter-like MFS transporter
MTEVSPQDVLRKVTWRLIPFIFLLYVVNILDRVNVGFARLTMLADLEMSETAYALGAGLFYIGYLLFEVPSNLIMNRTGARRWIGRIMVSWGIISCAMLLVRGPWSFYALRLLLGIAEAGFFPGIILYLTYWFPARQRARAVSCFMTGSPLVGIIQGPLSGGILEYLDGAGGLAGWQWLFLLEGAPAVFLGFVVLFYLTDRPAQANWLSAEERDWLAQEMAQEECQRRAHGLSSFRALADGRVWLLILLYFTVAAGTNSIGFYLPKLIDSRIEGLSKIQIGFLSTIPSLCAIAAMVVVGTHSDRTGERRWHVALAAFTGGIGWTIAAWAPTPALSLAGLAVAHAGMMSMLAPFWSLPTAFLSGTAAAGGIALINSLGNLGGFVGPNIVGQSQALTGSFELGLTALAGLMAAGGVLALTIRHERAAAKEDIADSDATKPFRGGIREEITAVPYSFERTPER